MTVMYKANIQHGGNPFLQLRLLVVRVSIRLYIHWGNVWKKMYVMGNGAIEGKLLWFCEYVSKIVNNGSNGRRCS